MMAIALILRWRLTAAGYFTAVNAIAVTVCIIAIFNPVYELNNDWEMSFALAIYTSFFLVRSVELQTYFDWLRSRCPRLLRRVAPGKLYFSFIKGLGTVFIGLYGYFLAHQIFVQTYIYGFHGGALVPEKAPSLDCKLPRVLWIGERNAIVDCNHRLLVVRPDELGPLQVIPIEGSLADLRQLSREGMIIPDTPSDDASHEPVEP